jgi:hypothetical protein
MSRPTTPSSPQPQPQPQQQQRWYCPTKGRNVGEFANGTTTVDAVTESPPPTAARSTEGAGDSSSNSNSSNSNSNNCNYGDLYGCMVESTGHQGCDDSWMVQKSSLSKRKAPSQASCGGDASPPPSASFWTRTDNDDDDNSNSSGMDSSKNSPIQQQQRSAAEAAKPSKRAKNSRSSGTGSVPSNMKNKDGALLRVRFSSNGSSNNGDGASDSIAAEIMAVAPYQAGMADARVLQECGADLWYTVRACVRAYSVGVGLGVVVAQLSPLAALLLPCCFPPKKSRPPSAARVCVCVCVYPCVLRSGAYLPHTL